MGTVVRKGRCPLRARACIGAVARRGSKSPPRRLHDGQRTASGRATLARTRSIDGQGDSQRRKGARVCRVSCSEGWNLDDESAYHPLVVESANRRSEARAPPGVCRLAVAGSGD